MDAEKGSVLVADPDRGISKRIADLVGQIGFASRTVGTGAEALAEARREMPALVVLDMDLANPSGYEVCRELREQFGEMLPIVFMSAAVPAPQDEIACLLLGGDDYFTNPPPADLFLAKVRRLVARSPRPMNASNLTNREQEVLGLLVDGRRTAEIAKLLCITHKTASTHIDRIRAKLGAHSQAQAVAFAVRDNVVRTAA
jgi:DNA-binding response OmpR family regulator